MERSISQTPSISLKFKVVDDVKANNNAKKIASKDIYDQVIPPALLEVIKNIA